MQLLLDCGICCMLLSIWGIVQLMETKLIPIIFVIRYLRYIFGGLRLGRGIKELVASCCDEYRTILMGVFFKMEVITFIEEAEPSHSAYDDYDDFMKQTKENYQQIAINCWIAAVLYAVTLGLSYWCIKHAKAKVREAEANLSDDEAFCKGKAKKS